MGWCRWWCGYCQRKLVRQQQQPGLRPQTTAACEPNSTRLFHVVWLPELTALMFGRAGLARCGRRLQERS